MEELSAYDAKLGRILKDSAAIFAEKGYHRASIREIAQATGISLSGLYYYFRSKEELLFLIQDHCFTTILERLERDLHGVEDPEARLRIVIQNHLTFFVNNMREMKVLSHEAESLSGEYRERINEKKRRYVQVVRETLEALAPPGSQVDLRVATFALFGMMNWIYNWYRRDRDIPVDGLAEAMSHIFLRGYLSPLAEAGAPAPGTEAGPRETSIWRAP